MNTTTQRILRRQGLVMIEETQVKLNLFKRVINGLALAYLVLMVVYGVLRLTVGDGNPRLSLVNSFAYFLFLPLPLLLTLTLLARSRLAFLRLLPIAVVLLVWIGPRFVPKPIVAASGEKTIRVFTANTWVSNSLPDLLETQLRDSGADILCLEEVTPDFAVNRLIHLQSLYPYRSKQFDVKRPGDNYVLSRYPIISSELVELGMPDFPAPLRVVIDVDAQPMAVYSVHMAWPLDDDANTETGLNYYVGLMLAFNDRIRNQQIHQLIARIKDEELPYIVAGDFNTSDFSVTYTQLASVMHDSFLEAGTGLGGSWPVTTHNNMPKWLPPLMRIDYIWHGNGFRTVRSWQGLETGSDHLPLLAELALEA